MDMRRKSREEVHKALRQALGKEPNPRIWRRLIDTSYVDTARAPDQTKADAEDNFETLIAQYRFVEPIVSASRRRPGETETIDAGPPDERRIWLFKLLAIDAANDPEVISFRSEVLGGNLLDGSDVDTWMREQEEREANYRVRFHIPIQTDSPRIYEKARTWAMDRPADEPGSDFLEELGRTLLNDIRNPAYPRKTKYCPDIYLITEGPVFDHANFVTPELQYRLPNHSVKSVFCAPDGVLDRLAKIGAMLAEYYLWSEAQATVFVLTDIPPEPLAETALVYYHHQYPALDRVTLTIGLDTSPKKLAAFYTMVRNRLQQPGKHKPPERYRQLSEKACRLALFTRMHQGETVKDRLERWNSHVAAEHPEWQYNKNDIRNFDKHSKKAVQDLIGEEDANA